MNTVFRSMFGAALLLAGSAVGAMAQDYTWTLQNFKFGDYFDTGNNYQGTEATSVANGTLVLSRDGDGFKLKSFNFTTTNDGHLGGGTGFAATYNSANNGNYGTDTPAFDTYIEMAGEATDGSGSEFFFHLSWDNAALFDEMNGNFGAGNLGAVINLDGLNSYEYDLDGNFIRYNDNTNGINNAFVQEFPGQLVLTAVPPPVSTPEPASLALLGTGLLGIYAARRRKTA